MASAIIHLAIAKELEKEFNIKNKKDYYLLLNKLEKLKINLILLLIQIKIFQT